MTPGEVLFAVTRRGGSISVGGDSIRIHPRAAITQAESVVLLAHKPLVLSYLRRLHRDESPFDYAYGLIGFAGDPTADDLVDTAERLGVDLYIRSSGDIGIRHADRLPNDLIYRLTCAHNRLLAALARRENPGLSNDLHPCVRCGIRQQCYCLDDGSTVCPSCAEWECRPLHVFTLPVALEEEVAQRYGCCLACGGTWELHGCPAANEGVRVADYSSIATMSTRLVLARAHSLLVDDVT